MVSAITREPRQLFDYHSHQKRYESIQLKRENGSGEIESAHRYIPQKRLNIPGATGHRDTILSENWRGDKTHQFFRVIFWLKPLLLIRFDSLVTP